MSETAPDINTAAFGKNKNVLLISLQADLSVIGLRYLHYCLMREGFQSFYLHIPNYSPQDQGAFDNLKEFVSRINPLFIGLSGPA